MAQPERRVAAECEPAGTLTNACIDRRAQTGTVYPQGALSFEANGAAPPALIEFHA
jgi:hypothetical protein